MLRRKDYNGWPKGTDCNLYSLISSNSLYCFHHNVQTAPYCLSSTLISIPGLVPTF